MTARSRWLLGATLLVLAGLFGMHGLGDHPSMDHSPAASATHASHVADPGTLSASPAGGDDGSMGPMAWCVAVLLGGVLGLALALAARAPGSRTTPRPAWTRLPVPRGRDPDPPTPLLLSIWRC